MGSIARSIRWSWWGAGFGSLFWMAIMAIAWAVQGASVAAGSIAAVFLLGVAYLSWCTPWRFAHTPIRRLTAGLLAIVALGVGVAAWHVYAHLGRHGPLPLGVAVVAVLLLGAPGRRSWAEMVGDEEQVDRC
ncbi:MAG: hypothetical protein ACOCZK_07060 [Planctomycetota bacterium]